MDAVSATIEKLNGKFIGDTGTDPNLGAYLKGYNDGISIGIEALQELKGKVTDKKED